jgi:hypothetical protein
MPRIKEQELKAQLAKRGFESVSIKRELPGGRIQVEANKLYPVHVEAGESIYAPVPVSLSVELDARGRVKSIAGDTPTPAAVTDAARYIKTLRDSGQLTSTGEQQSAGGVTHQIERDEQGRGRETHNRAAMARWKELCKGPGHGERLDPEVRVPP